MTTFKGIVGTHSQHSMRDQPQCMSCCRGSQTSDITRVVTIRENPSTILHTIMGRFGHLHDNHRSMSFGLSGRISQSAKPAVVAMTQTRHTFRTNSRDHRQSICSTRVFAGTVRAIIKAFPSARVARRARMRLLRLRRRRRHRAHVMLHLICNFSAGFAPLCQRSFHASRLRLSSSFAERKCALTKPQAPFRRHDICSLQGKKDKITILY